MDLVRVKGGRSNIEAITFPGRLPSSDDDPLDHFVQNYGLSLAETVALIGGAHNFGSAHAKCAGYVGQWTPTPLSWFGPFGSAPTFFVDLLRDDWRWYELCTYENNTVSYTSIEDPFTSDSMEEEGEHGNTKMQSACPMMQSKVPLLCEEQAMRGCKFSDGTYKIDESPCDIENLQFRLKSDFFLKANPQLLPFAKEFASNPDLLAEKFGTAYHKVTHIGLDRCGLSGHGCSEGTTCSMTEASPLATCIIDQNKKSSRMSSDAFERAISLSSFFGLAFLLMIAICLIGHVRNKVEKLSVSEKSAALTHPTQTMASVKSAVEPLERSERVKPNEYMF